MKKVMTIVGTRPEIIKLSRVITELDKFTEHILVHTGQNYDPNLSEVFVFFSCYCYLNLTVYQNY